MSGGSLKPDARRVLTRHWRIRPKRRVKTPCNAADIAQAAAAPTLHRRDALCAEGGGEDGGGAVAAYGVGGVEVGEGAHDEGAQVGAGVGQGEGGVGGFGLGVVDEVEVKGARGVGEGAFAAEFLLGLLHQIEEFAGGEGGFDDGGGIGEIGLVCVADGGGAVEGGEAQGQDLRVGAQVFGGGGDGVGGRAKVAAEGDGGGGGTGVGYGGFRWCLRGCWRGGLKTACAAEAV